VLQYPFPRAISGSMSNARGPFLT